MVSGSVNGQFFVEDVPLASIFLDTSYGRCAIPPHVEGMAAEWDEKAAAVVLLSLREDGRYACLDGWQRVNAKRLIDPSGTMRGNVYIDLTVEQEAHYFKKYNADRKPLRPFELFRSRLKEGESKALLINRIVESLGLILDDGRERHALKAISAVERVFDMDGNGSLLRNVLLILRGAWEAPARDAPARSDAFRAEALRGLALFLIRYPNVDRGELRSVLSAIGSKGMIIQMYRMLELTRGSHYIAWGRALLDRYNWKRRSHRLEEWKEMTWAPAGATSMERRKEGRLR